MFWFINYKSQEELKKLILIDLENAPSHRFAEEMFVPDLNKANKDWYEKVKLLQKMTNLDELNKRLEPYYLRLEESQIWTSSGNRAISIVGMGEILLFNDVNNISFEPLDPNKLEEYVDTFEKAMLLK